MVQLQLMTERPTALSKSLRYALGFHARLDYLCTRRQPPEGDSFSLCDLDFDVHISMIEVVGRLPELGIEIYETGISLI